MEDTKLVYSIAFRQALNDYLLCREKHLFWAVALMKTAIAHYLNNVDGMMGEW